MMRVALKQLDLIGIDMTAATISPNQSMTPTALFASARPQAERDGRNEEHEIMKARTKVIETIKIAVHTTVSDIKNGRCGLVGRCMEKVAIERALRKMDPSGGDHHVRIDGGDIRFNLAGHKWHAPTPKVAKRALIAFDRERKRRSLAEKRGEIFESKVQPHSYRFEATKREKIQRMTRERQEQINAARRKRQAEGRPDKKTYDLRYRVEGLGSV